MRRASILGICVIAILFLPSSYTYSGGFSISWGGDHHETEVQPAIKSKKNGPPAHAPAYGYRAKHQYYYYPSSSVYHDPDRGLYFYLSGSNWRVSASLPTDLRMHLGTSVSMGMETDKPYIYNAEHRKQYPPGQMKNMKKSKKDKWAKQ